MKRKQRLVAPGRGVGARHSDPYGERSGGTGPRKARRRGEGHGGLADPPRRGDDEADSPDGLGSGARGRRHVIPASLGTHLSSPPWPWLAAGAPCGPLVRLTVPGRARQQACRLFPPVRPTGDLETTAARRGSRSMFTTRSAGGHRGTEKTTGGDRRIPAPAYQPRPGSGNVLSFLRSQSCSPMLSCSPNQEQCGECVLPARRRSVYAASPCFSSSVSP